MTLHKVAGDLGIDPETLRRWLRLLAATPEPSASRTPAASAAELARRRREVEQLRQERDILHKAIGIFSPMPH